MIKEEILKKHPKEVAILLEIYKRSITHIEGFEKITWATSFQISEAIEAMNIHADLSTQQLREENERLKEKNVGMSARNCEHRDEIDRLKLELKAADHDYGQTIIGLELQLKAMESKVKSLEDIIEQTINAYEWWLDNEPEFLNQSDIDHLNNMKESLINK